MYSIFFEDTPKKRETNIIKKLNAQLTGLESAKLKKNTNWIE